MTVPPHYCALAFVGAQVTPRGAVRPCCRFGVDLPETQLDAALQSAVLHRVRAEMLAGQPSPECARCLAVEATGAKSLRSYANSHLGTPTEVRLEALEVAFSNLCNLACRSCSSLYSTRWRADEQRLGTGPALGLTESGVDLGRVDLGGLRWLKFFGGEPLLQQAIFCDLLRRIEAAGALGGLSVDIATNGTLLPGPDLRALLSRCKDVCLQYSLDATGPLSDYIRAGSRWAVLEGNLRIFTRDLGYSAFVNTVVSVMNVNLLHRLDEHMDAAFPRIHHNYDLAVQPVAQAVQNLPDAAKAVLRSRAGERLGGRRTDGYRKLLGALDRPRTAPVEAVRASLAALDAVRGESFATVNPEMAGWLDV